MDSARSLADLRPGMIGFGPIKGGAGMLVNAGQLLLGEGFRVGTLDIRHVFMVTGWRPRGDDELMAVEAMPTGAREVTIRDRWTSDYAYVQLAEDYPGQAEDAAAIARAMVGTPYSFASYGALAAWKFGLKAERLERWIDRRKPHTPIPGHSHPEIQIALPREAICSVLADQAWSLAGKRIMHGVARQCVTPGALARRLLEMAAEGESAVWSFPRGS